jgi:hypothetical protein
MRSPLKVFLVLFLLALIGLGIYRRYEVRKRYENIARFDYSCKDSIDYSYYDQTALRIYLDNCDKLTDIAKGLWLKEGIDVTTTKNGYGEIQSRINRYNTLLRYTKSIEDKLVQSQDMKDQGLTNDDIRIVLDKDITIGAVENEKDKMAAYEFLRGKNVSASSKPNEIWELQKLLNANDYNLSINGVYDASTDSALLDFQKDNNLYPAHMCDDLTLKKLAE